MSAEIDTAHEWDLAAARWRDDRTPENRELLEQAKTRHESRFVTSAAADMLHALEMVLNDPNAGDLMGCVLTAIHGALDKAKGGAES